jgi:ribonucleoside-diphosphate reductase alpha chain
LAINYLGRHDLAHIAPEDVHENRHLKSKGVATGSAELAGATNIVMKASSTTTDVSGGISTQSQTVTASFEEDIYERYNARYEARIKGYEGDPCPECQALTLVRNGSCLKCDSCGTTTGCS